MGFALPYLDSLEIEVAAPPQVPKNPPHWGSTEFYLGFARVIVVFRCELPFALRFPSFSPTPTGGRQLTSLAFVGPSIFDPQRPSVWGSRSRGVHLPARDFGTCRVTHQAGFPF